MKKDFYGRFNNLSGKTKHQLYENFLAYIMTGSNDFLKTEVYVNPDPTEIREIKNSFDYTDSLIRGIIVTAPHKTIYTIKGYDKEIILNKDDVLMFNGENALHDEIIKSLHLPETQVITIETDVKTFLKVTMTLSKNSVWYENADIKSYLVSNPYLQSIMDIEHSYIDIFWEGTEREAGDLFIEWKELDIKDQVKLVYLLTRDKKELYL